MKRSVYKARRTVPTKDDIELKLDCIPKDSILTQTEYYSPGWLQFDISNNGEFLRKWVVSKRHFKKLTHDRFIDWVKNLDEIEPRTREDYLECHKYKFTFPYTGDYVHTLKIYSNHTWCVKL